ncbi:MAG: outer membrane lipid asymmetry maintenance protein MlaD [Alphaproteobacteria bacterium]
MGRNLIETVMGAAVLAVAVVFVLLAYSSASVRAVDGYELDARFNRVDGLTIGSDVRLGGIKIGSVSALELDIATYQAVAKLGIASGIELPLDSSARVLSEGLLGGSYIDIQPGGDFDMMQPGDAFEFTQDPVNLVDLLGRFVFSAAETKDEGEAQP